jgi:hypothetical protein
MTKTVFVFIVFFISVLTYGQEVEKMEITPDGVNGFLVCQFEGKKAEEIYKSIKDWTEYNIKNASFATNSTVENEYISFKVKEVGIITLKTKPAWNLDLDVEVRIKPNKARVDLKILEIDGIKESTNSLDIVGGGVIMGLYKKNGKPVSGYAQTRAEINQTLNEFANRIFESVNGQKDYRKDDW